MQRPVAKKQPAPPPVYLEEPNPPANDFEVNIRRVFAGDRMADIRVIFGYEDYEDFKDPNDPGRARRLVEYLTATHFVMIPVTEELAKELGVRPDAPNLRILQGPGIVGQTLRISLMWSAATTSTAKNLGSGYGQQLICSNDSLQFMQKAAAEAEVMYYIGHSRGGGGPDTFPPKTRKGTSENRQPVDFNYYGSNQPGLASLSSYFGSNKDNPKFIALTGCLSDKHFHNWLAKRLAGNTFPTSVLLSTRLTRSKPWENTIEGNDEAVMALVNLIQSLQKYQTAAEFKARLKQCEIEEMRDIYKDAWKLVTIPSPTTPKLAVKAP